jgi:carbon storage regulator CsrA
VNGRKQPFYIHPQDDGQAFAFAGLWDQWRGPDEHIVESCTILTTSANDLVRPLHDRMPVILDPGDFDLWLDPGVQNPEAARPLLRPYPAEATACHPVGRYVNNPVTTDRIASRHWIAESPRRVVAARRRDSDQVAHIARATHPPPECGATDRRSAVSILTRRLGQAVRVGDDVRVVVLEVRGQQAPIGIDASDDARLCREELTDEEREQYRIGADDEGAGET